MGDTAPPASVHDIADELNRRGLRNKKGGVWKAGRLWARFVSIEAEQQKIADGNKE
jgi:hypothetical protein